MRVEFLNFLHDFLEIQSLEEDLRLIRHVSAAELLQNLPAC